MEVAGMENLLEYTCKHYDAGSRYINSYWNGESEEKFLYDHCDCGGPGSQCKFYNRDLPNLPLCRMVVDLDANPDFRFSDHVISKEERRKMMNILKECDFTRDMLRTYHIVKLKNGLYGTFYKDKDDDLIIVYGDDDGSWDLAKYAYSPKMESMYRSNGFDIVQVYEVPICAFWRFRYIDTMIDTVVSMCELIWEREEKKEMTIAEIEKELGYSIKIVKEENDG